MSQGIVSSIDISIGKESPAYAYLFVFFGGFKAKYELDIPGHHKLCVLTTLPDVKGLVAIGQDEGHNMSS